MINMRDSSEALDLPEKGQYRQDCATVAHSLAFDIPYLKAHAEISRLGLDNYWREYASTFPVKEVALYTESYRPSGSCCILRQPLNKKITTLGAFIEEVKEDETWIRGVRGHVLTIKDGVMLDRKSMVENGEGELRRKVNVAYRIK